MLKAAVKARRLVPLVHPLAWAWAAWRRARALRRGVALLPHEADIARRVGVRSPQRIRVVRFERSPFPFARLADRAAGVLGLPATRVDGLALGHAVFIERDAQSLRLLAHECRHVQQCEAAGGLGRFLWQYLRQMARHGYAAAPLEVDAREAALRAVPPDAPGSGPGPRPAAPPAPTVAL